MAHTDSPVQLMNEAVSRNVVMHVLLTACCHDDVGKISVDGHGFPQNFFRNQLLQNFKSTLEVVQNEMKTNLEQYTSPVKELP